MTAQPLASLAWLEFLGHKLTQLTVEGYSTTPLLLHRQAGGLDGDWLALLPHLDLGSLLLHSLGNRSSVAAGRYGFLICLL